MSEIIAGFLEGIRRIEIEYGAAQAEICDMEAATQDILHFLELDEISYFEREKYASMLGGIRRKRREAKDKTIVLIPLLEWAEKNKGVFKSLERVLGEMRKAERYIKNRNYTPKILEKTND